MRHRISRRSSLITIGMLCANLAHAACPPRPIKLAHFEFGHAYHGGSGMEVDLVEEMKRRSGCAISGEVYPRARIWSELESGHLDMALTAIQSKERERYAWYVPYLQQKNYVLLREGVLTTIRNGQEFLQSPTLRFAAVRGYRHGAPYDDLIANLAKQGRLDLVPNSPRLFDMLRAGRVQAALAVPLVYRYELERRPIPGLRVVDWAPRDVPPRSGLMLSKASFTEQDAHFWRGIFEAMARDGTLLRIVQRYLPPDEAQAALLK
ncbi:transporter substrate-binding domain-containing protein [Paucibacter sp. R3-3]|uniref:Transporter substrate-binding domain-containing protein n=1 Tax=Roseateles agri TaxID=3098619 RepID=A0ABU5DQQ6_9BURK|nr:transporter substrate-binding domain-containing protein [Paucibacter sp. R3-3]MDY0748036.1 transporter substrate-binding domain-containing protein [Paucibacter sp. R3-3]